MEQQEIVEAVPFQRISWLCAQSSPNCRCWLFSPFSSTKIRASRAGINLGSRILRFPSSDWSRTVGAHLDERLITPISISPAWNPERSQVRPAPCRLSYHQPPLMDVFCFVFFFQIQLIHWNYNDKYSSDATPSWYGGKRTGPRVALRSNIQ